MGLMTAFCSKSSKIALYFRFRRNKMQSKNFSGIFLDKILAREVPE